MRILKDNVKISCRDTKEFFKKRAEKFNEDNPYSVTMYQDNNRQLVLERNMRETEKLYPLLKINGQSKVLDIACGIGRWADALPDTIKEYCGIDFSEELIAIAQNRNKRENFHFFTGSTDQLRQILHFHKKSNYNTILMIGILLYLNDEKVISLFRQIETICTKKARICIREPLARKDRLTLKNFFSDELQDNYNAIYRTEDELLDLCRQTLFQNGFSIIESGPLFDEDKLNNRKETAQYYFILERES